MRLILSALFIMALIILFPIPGSALTTTSTNTSNYGGNTFYANMADPAMYYNHTQKVFPIQEVFEKAWVGDVGTFAGDDHGKSAMVSYYSHGVKAFDVVYTLGTFYPAGDGTGGNKTTLTMDFLSVNYTELNNETTDYPFTNVIVYDQFTHGGGGGGDTTLAYDDKTNQEAIRNALPITITQGADKRNHYVVGSIRILTYNSDSTSPPPSGSGCNVTARVENVATGNLVLTSTFNLYDSLNGNKTSVYLPYGFGNITIPQLGREYVWNGTAYGYTGEPAIVSGANGTPMDVCDENPLLAFIYKSSGLAAGNTTLLFNVQGLTCFPCSISGALVTLDTGQAGYTNDAGTASFVVPSNAGYSYDVEKSGYLGVSGNITIGSESYRGVPVYLTEGTNPTATLTGAIPTLTGPGGTNEGVDTSTDALNFILANAWNIVVFLICLFFIGGVKLINK